MPDAPDISTFHLLVVAVGGIGLFALIRLFRALVGAAEMSRETRERLAQAGPLVELLVWVVFVATAAAWLLDGHRLGSFVLLAVLGAGFAAAAWFAVRDYLAGVVLRAERSLREGDVVQVGGVAGRVASMGFRVMEIERPDGDRVTVPYTRIAGESVVRRPGRVPSAHHTFEVALPEALAPGVAATRVREAALLSHWSVPTWEPRLRPLGDGRLEVTVSALAPERATAIEAAIRAALAADPAPRPEPEGPEPPPPAARSAGARVRVSSLPSDPG